MRLPQQHIEWFHQEGYLIVPDAIPLQDLQPVIDEHAEIVDRMARELHAQGIIDDLHEDVPFERRFVLLDQKDNTIFRKIDIHHNLGRATFDFLKNRHLLDMIESIIGPEITLSPVMHVRAKMPSELTQGGSHSHEVPWHQDTAVVWSEADPHLCVTAWIALCESTKDNGCVQIVPRAHTQGLLEHEQTKNGTTIKPSALPDTDLLNVEVPAGGLVLMHSLTPHRSCANVTDRIRWSMDLRFLKTGLPTGRPFHPEFVLRSVENPGSMLSSYDVWKSTWLKALEDSKGIKFHRYHDKHEEQKRKVLRRKPPSADSSKSSQELEAKPRKSLEQGSLMKNLAHRILGKT